MRGTGQHGPVPWTGRRRKVSPYRIYKTLMLHGSLTAREVAAAWAVIDESEVRPESEARIALALNVMARHGMVTRDEEEYEDMPPADEGTVWTTLPLPPDGIERRNLLRRVDYEWKRVRPRA